MKTADEKMDYEKVITQIIDNPANTLSKTSRDLLETLAINCELITEEQQKEIDRLKNELTAATKRVKQYGYERYDEGYKMGKTHGLESQSQLLKLSKEALEQSEKLISSLISLGEGTEAVFDYEKDILERVEQTLSKLSKHEQE